MLGIDFNDKGDIDDIDGVELFIEFLKYDKDDIYRYEDNILVNDIMILVYKDDYNNFLEFIKGLELSDCVYNRVNKFGSYFNGSDVMLLFFSKYKCNIDVYYSIRVELYLRGGSLGNYDYYLDFRDKKFKFIDELKKII